MQLAYCPVRLVMLQLQLHVMLQLQLHVMLQLQLHVMLQLHLYLTTFGYSL